MVDHDFEEEERARLVCSVISRTDVLALNGSSGGAETQTNVLVPSAAALARSGGLDLGLGVEEDFWRTSRVSFIASLSPTFQFGRVFFDFGCRLIFAEEKLTMRLLLKSTLALDGKLGSHLVGSGVGRRCAFVEVGVVVGRSSQNEAPEFC